MLKKLMKLKRLKAYISSFCVFVGFVIAGILIYVFGKEQCEFWANVMISISASILAGIITAIFIDLSDENEKEKLVKKAFNNVFVWLRFYTLNLNYHFITESIDGKLVSIDTSKSSYELMIERFKELGKLTWPGKRYTEKVKNIHEYLYSSCEYYLRMISKEIGNAINENAIIHHVDDYLLDLNFINQYIEKLLDSKTTKIVAENLANIIELLMNLKPICSDFENPIENYKDQIPLLKIYLDKKENK